MSEKNAGGSFKTSFSAFNEKICFSKEISSIGTVGRVRLLKGGAAKFLNFIGRSFAYASTRTYGCFMLSFGLVSLFLQFAEFYFKSEQGDAFSNIIISAVIALIGIPLLIIDRPICIVAQDFFVTDYLFFEFLSIKRMQANVNHPSIKILGGIFLGFIPAVVSFFVPIHYVVITLFLIAVTTVAFTTPEFPMVLTILVLPYVSLISYSEIVLVCLCAVTFLSYALKVILGKRVYNFCIYDIFVCLLAFFAFIGGFFGAGEDSLRNALILIALLLIYFPANNLIVNRRLADLLINTFVISSIPVTVISIVEFIVENVNPKAVVPQYSTPGMSAFFSTPEALSAFLLVSSVFALTHAVEKRRPWKKTLYFAVFGLEAVALGLTMQPFVWIAMLLSFPAYSIITSRKIPMDALVLLMALPLVLFALPVGSLDAVYKFLKISPDFSGIIAGYSESMNIFFENLWLGIGIGDASYSAVSGASSGGMFNMLLGVATELGIFALILLVSMILMLLRQLSYYRRFMTNSNFITVKDMSALAVTVFMIYSVGANVFEDIAIICLFFIMFGICSSVMRSARKEHDDRLGYYGDSSSSESSVIDVDIRR